MAEGTVGGNRGAGTKRLNRGAPEVTERGVGQTQVCTNLLPFLPPLLISAFPKQQLTTW